jgi:hypothetical protein
MFLVHGSIEYRSSSLGGFFKAPAMVRIHPSGVYSNLILDYPGAFALCIADLLYSTILPRGCRLSNKLVSPPQGVFTISMPCSLVYPGRCYLTNMILSRMHSRFSLVIALWLTCQPSSILRAHANIVPRSNAPKLVVAHVIVGNTYPYTKDNWKRGHNTSPSMHTYSYSPLLSLTL